MVTWVPDEWPFKLKPSNKILAKMKKQNYLCVDLSTLMKKRNLKYLESRKGTLTRDGENHFTFVERGARGHELMPWKHWYLIKRLRENEDAIRGKVSANDAHVKLEIYVRHGAYKDGIELADVLASVTEEMGETLCETDMQKLVEEIRKLKGEK